MSVHPLEAQLRELIEQWRAEAEKPEASLETMWSEALGFLAGEVEKVLDQAKAGV